MWASPKANSRWEWRAFFFHFPPPIWRILQQLCILPSAFRQQQPGQGRAQAGGYSFSSKKIKKKRLVVHKMLFCQNVVLPKCCVAKVLCCQHVVLPKCCAAKMTAAKMLCAKILIAKLLVTSWSWVPCQGQMRSGSGSTAVAMATNLFQNAKILGKK